MLRFLLPALAPLVICATACGTDVDLGGTTGTTQCGSLAPPTVDAGCKACTPSSGNCQANGCYGGFWCDTSKVDCNPPPDACP